MSVSLPSAFSVILRATGRLSDPDALQWSADNSLAVVTERDVHVLDPVGVMDVDTVSTAYSGCNWIVATATSSLREIEPDQTLVGDRPLGLWSMLLTVQKRKNSLATTREEANLNAEILRETIALHSKRQ